MIILSSPYFAKARTHDMIINLNGDLIHPNRAVRNLGVIFDNTMNMESHVNKICQTAYIHLRNIKKNQALYHKRCMRVLSTCLHNFKTRLCKYGTIWPSNISYRKLQRVQNFSARLITGSYKYDHLTPVLKSLHLFPVEQRIRYKIAVLGFKCVYGSAPGYLQNHLKQWFKQLWPSDALWQHRSG